MWNILIRDVKIDAYTLMLDPSILITTFKLLSLILFTDICWVIEIKIKELAKNETPEYYEELKYEIQPLKPMILHTHIHKKLTGNAINTDSHFHILQFIDD